MTRKEALQRIVDNNFAGEYGFDLQILIDCMVIVREIILNSQFLSEDTISRQAVLEIAKSSKSNWIDNSVLFKRVNELPSVNPQPKTGWIPVSVRLPKEDESVLLTICANDSLCGFNKNFVKVMCGSYSPCEDKRDWVVNEIRYYIDNVIAWMPLPQSYDPQEIENKE